MLNFKIYRVLFALLGAIGFLSACAPSPEAKREAAQREFFQAIKEREPDNITVALQKGADINAPVGEMASEIRANSPSHTALIYAVHGGRTELVPLLLQHGADPNIFDEQGHTALHHAVTQREIRLVRLLLEKGADPKAFSRRAQRTTSLHLACAEHHLEIVRLLLTRRADSNAQTRSDVSPLMLAAYGQDVPNNAQIVALLLKNGAKPTLRDEDGLTAFDYAKKLNSARIMKLLRH